MDPFSIPLIVTVVLAVLGLLYGLFSWSRTRGGRGLLQGIGLALIPVGLYVIGWMHMLINGVNSLVDWFNRVTPNTTLWIGVALAGVGLLLWLIGNFIPKVSREEAAKRRDERAAKKARVREAERRAAGQPSTRAVEGSKPAAAPATRTNSDPALAEDDEVAAILRKHGID